MTMRYIVIKDVKSNPSKATYTILPVGVKDAEEFAELLVKAHEGSVKYCDSFAEVQELLKPKAEAKDDVFAYAGPKTLKSFPILDPNADEASLRSLFTTPTTAEAETPSEAPACQPGDTPPEIPARRPDGTQELTLSPDDFREVYEGLRIVRGILEDIKRCRYGVSISSLATQAEAQISYITNAFAKAERRD